MNPDGAADRLLEELRRRGWRVAVAESCTGGEVLARLTAAPGASASVWGGAVVYDEAAKTILADVDSTLLARHGVVSEAVTAALAHGIRACSGVDLGIAVTGWAGPDSDGSAPVGTVYLGVDAGDVARVERHRFTGGRATIRRLAGDALLTMAAGVLREES